MISTKPCNSLQKLIQYLKRGYFKKSKKYQDIDRKGKEKKVKPVGDTKAIRIYPMPDETYGIMWKIHPPKSCWEEFDRED